ncbi:DNA photolyase family protein [bacterium]|nr:DNA photolyase family protein [bacterium]
MAPTILWFRRDLRLTDNSALIDAVERGESIIPIYIHKESESRWSPGAASRWWLHHSLQSLREALEARGSRLILRRGNALDVLRSLIDDTGAEAVFWNRQYEPETIKRDTQIKSALKEQGIEPRSHNAALLWEPWAIETKQGKPYQVFTPFWKACQSQAPSRPEREVRKIPTPKDWPTSLHLEELSLLPKIDWAAGFRADWTPGEKGAKAQLRRFVRDSLERYSDGRDRPDMRHTSRLSPHLAFGEISPRHAYWEARDAGQDATKFLSEVAWREFAYHLLYHFPETTDQALRPQFREFPWAEDEKMLRAWQRGRTGYPIVDAGMRELWHTGWMHNRVRMIVASFLTKDLLIPWQRGAEWFWDTLVDADLANNTLGWQWTAGCGADAAPYFRIFNPVSQGERYDPDGAYVRRWVPELRDLPKKYIHQPWAASPGVLAQANVKLGENYPRPIVDHAKARMEALNAYEKIKKKS